MAAVNIGGLASLAILRIMNHSGSCSWKLLVSFFVYCACIIGSTTAGEFVEDSLQHMPQVTPCPRVTDLCSLGKSNVVCSNSVYTATTITEGPVSVTALIGTNAQFHCAGTGVGSGWTTRWSCQHISSWDNIRHDNIFRHSTV